MRLLSGLAITLTLALHVSHAQTFRFGLVVGSPLTNDYGHRDNFLVYDFSGDTYDFKQTSAARGFPMGGVLAEWHFFSKHVSLAANGLYRAIHYNETQVGPRDTVLTWELPVLLKYSFKPTAGLHPFLEAGPAFRATGNLNSHPSHAGFSAGAGLGIHFRFLDVAPGLRYTRWQKDPDYFTFTKSDQLELLVDLTRTFKFRSKRP